MIVTYSDDKRVTTALKLDSASNVVLVDTDQGAGEVKVLESLSVACDATPTNISVFFRKNGVDYPIIDGKQVTANDTIYIKDHHLEFRGGQQIRVQASAANHLTVIAVTIDSMPKRDNRGAPTGAVR